MECRLQSRCAGCGSGASPILTILHETGSLTRFSSSHPRAPHQPGAAIPVAAHAAYPFRLRSKRRFGVSVAEKSWAVEVQPVHPCENIERVKFQTMHESCVAGVLLLGCQERE